MRWQQSNNTTKISEGVGRYNHGSKRTSEWLKDINTFPIPLPSAAFLASPCNVTSGAPVSPLGRISMSCIAAPAPWEGTLSDLKTASLPAQRAANEAGGEGWELQ
jgi:hypothetical protein